MFYSSLIKLYQIIYVLCEFIDCECDIRSDSSYNVNNVFNELLIDL
jgi:hypothetical protein